MESQLGLIKMPLGSLQLLSTKLVSVIISGEDINLFQVLHLSHAYMSSFATGYCCYNVNRNEIGKD